MFVYQRTNGRTDGRTDGQTHPLIESWLTTKNVSGKVISTRTNEYTMYIEGNWGVLENQRAMIMRALPGLIKIIVC